jgi:ribonuclease T1
VPRLRRPLLALIVLLTILVVGYAIKAATNDSPPPAAKPTTSTSKTSSLIPLSSLPKEAQQTVASIQRGGPYPYRQDGVVYGNLERQLPAKPRGYYHEYTVQTPGSGDRGARRIVTGQDGQFYYTRDHYASFTLLDVRS